MPLEGCWYCLKHCDSYTFICVRILLDYRAESPTGVLVDPSKGPNKSCKSSLGGMVLELPIQATCILLIYLLHRSSFWILLDSTSSNTPQSQQTVMLLYCGAMLEISFFNLFRNIWKTKTLSTHLSWGRLMELAVPHPDLQLFIDIDTWYSQ